MKIKFMFYWIIGVLFLQSCYDDKGNYDYKNINEVTVKLPKKYFPNLIMGDPIVIEPEITFKNPKDTAYFKYEWYLASELISTSRNCNASWPELGETYGEFRVVDTLTNCQYIVNFSVDQVTPYETGWMVLYDRNGKSEYCYIQEKGGVYTDYVDFYQKLNGEGLGSTPLRMVEHYTTSSGISEVLVIQRGGLGCVEIDGRSLLKKVTTQQEFIGESLPENFAPVDASYAGYINYILNEDGRVFSRKANPNSLHTNRYSTLPLADNGKELKIGALVSVAESRAEFTVLFDETNNRLVGSLTRNNSLAGKLTDLYCKNYPEGAIPLNNIGEYKMVYTGAYLEGQQSCEFVSIFKDPQNQYKLQQYMIQYIVGGGLEVMKIEEPKITGNGLFNEQSLYFLLRRRPYIFFTTGANFDQLYYLDLATNKTNLYKDFEGERIVSLCADKTCQHLGVALENGRFVIFDVADQLLGREVKVLHSVDNLGKVVHAIYKYGNLANFTYN